MKWLAFFFTIFIFYIILLADTGNLGPLRIVYWIPYGDKFGHFILYGLLTLLIDLALIRAAPHRSPIQIVLYSGLVLALLIGIEEFSQIFVISRTFSLADLGFGYVGVLLFSWIALKMK